MPRLKLGEILVNNQAIDESTLRRALGSQARFAGQKIRLGQILVDMGACTPSDIAKALSQQLNIPLADLSTINPTLVARVPEELCRKHQVVAFAIDTGPPEAVRVAFFDPTDLAAVDAIRFKLGKPIRVAIGAGDAIARVIDQTFGGDKTTATEALDLGEMLFSDSETLSVEHYDASQPLAVSSVLEIEPLAAVLPDVFQSGDRPVGADEATADSSHAPAQPEAKPDLVQDSLSDLFGELNSELSAGETSEPAPAPRTAAPPKPLSFDAEEFALPRVEVTRFPDRRKRESRPLPPPMPKLVLTTQAFFSPGAPAIEGAAGGQDIGQSPPTTPSGPDPLADIMAGVELPPEGEAPIVPAAPQESLEFDPDLESGVDALFGSAEIVGATGAKLGEAASIAPDAGAAPEFTPAVGPPPGAADVSTPEVPAASSVEVPSAEMNLPGAEAEGLAAKAPELEQPTEVDDADLEPILEDASTGSSTSPDLPPPGSASSEEASPEPLGGAPSPTVSSPAPLANEIDSWVDSEGPSTASTLSPPPTEPQPPLEDLSIDFSLDEGDPSPAAPSGELEALAVFGVDVAAAQPEASTRSAPISAHPPADPVKEPPGLPELAAFATRPLTEEDLSILLAIERLADGLADEPEIRQVKPAHMVAALVRLLIRKGVIQENDFLSELSQK